MGVLFLGPSNAGVIGTGRHVELSYVSNKDSNPDLYAGTGSALPTPPPPGVLQV